MSTADIKIKRSRLTIPTLKFQFHPFNYNYWEEFPLVSNHEELMYTVTLPGLYCIKRAWSRLLMFSAELTVRLNSYAVLVLALIMQLTALYLKR